MATEEVDAHHICVSSGLQFIIDVYSPPKGRLLNIFHWVIEQYKIVWEFFPSHYRGLATTIMLIELPLAETRFYLLLSYDF